VPAHVTRELVITVPLPDDKGLHRDGRSRVHRFRSHWLELGQRLRAFRARYGVTQEEIAAVVGARDGSAVSQWETATTVPNGPRRERLTKLLQERSWPELRAAASAGEGLPVSWARSARWYRRASRERRARETWGSVIAAVLGHLRAEESPEALRDRYRAHDGNWVHGVATRCGRSEMHGVALRRIEDAAYGLRWLEIAQGWRCDLNASLVGQLPLGWLGPRPYVRSRPRVAPTAGSPLLGGPQLPGTGGGD
jgi:transcriptional regulator with XRE-family HTH domain